MSEDSVSGGCQCGAVRFSVNLPLGRASLCHCRMCQKATGGFFGPFVSVISGMTWTRGAPAYFQSSNRVRRGFCAQCGTPLSFEPDTGDVDLSIGAFDDPAPIRPTIQHDVSARMPWFEDLAGLPVRTREEVEKVQPYFASIVSLQHPDRDTD
ncbi:GFA family protein [Phenylobacterium montanum]|uniref:GFA family protein n=1 Tax=Phenylobacterium montanum TaxID=2823693 RepID=A0A975FWY7_9CAUL|nr:GFA family protein [Caulobacter sp. S6]QUD86676.1 GFA family protein [Caulobacter sp. S6]